MHTDFMTFNNRGYTMFWRHRRGRSAERSRTTPASMPSENHTALTSLRSGSRAEVNAICTGCKARCRLASLGLFPGCTLQVVANPGIGPLLLSVGESRLMVERGVAEKVHVFQV